jgi:hypothetical protein
MSLARLTRRRLGFVLAMAMALTFPMVIGEGIRDGNYQGVFVHGAFYFMTGGSILAVVAASSALGAQVWNRPWAFTLAVLAGCALGALAIHLVMKPELELPNFGIEGYLLLLRRALMSWGPAIAGLYFLERSLRRSTELREAEIDRKRLAGQMLEARLQVMQAQVEPHFLFNTLAHLQRLYQTNPARARSMLDSFCAYLRTALPHMRGHGSTLGREIDLAAAYLAIQQIRMGRRLRFEVAVQDDLRDAELPPMMLLSLAENAIKHGLTPLREGGRLRIEAASTADTLRVRVIDTGQGLAAAPDAGGSGIGLSNIRSRLAALHGERGHLSLCRNVPRGVVATIEVPLQRAPGEVESARAPSETANWVAAEDRSSIVQGSHMR